MVGGLTPGGAQTNPDIEFKMPRIAFTSVGCKLNRYEIQVMAEALLPYGFEIVPFSQTADCYVINTCSVTGDADLSSRHLIRRARGRNPNSKVIATGCYAQLRPEDFDEIEVDAVISNRDKENISGIILQLFDIPHKLEDADYSPVISGMEGMTRAFVKIQDGCDEQCSFCTIWIARGALRSRPIRQIIDEINNLSDHGYKEAVLTGVHIGKYSFEEHDFTNLLTELLSNTKIERIRLSSLNPSEISVELVSLLKTEPRLCPHIHLSLQSGDDGVLQAMGRKYGRAEIIDALDRLTSSIPNITIGADLIAGFPGETVEAFENTKWLIDDGRLHHLHIFPYSDRPRTKASIMAGKIDAVEKSRRTKILREIGQIQKWNHLDMFVGQSLQVLFEKRELRGQKLMTGLSENYLRIDAPLNKRYLGEIMDVMPDKRDGDHLITKFITGVSQAKSD
jgi:threonylcarbamoyladenosine tRNA methylthiotransferase MtaB